MTLLHRTLDSDTITESPHVTIFADRCAGCQECVIRCPMGALTMDLSSWIAVARDDRCVGCRQCVRTCPFGAIKVEGPLMVASRVDIAQQHMKGLEGNLEETRHGIESWTDVLAETSRCLHCPDPTCVRGCPAHNDIPSFIAAVSAGDLDEAHKVIRSTSFLPDICSRVCDQALQCEGACTWSLAGGEPVAIGAIERFITDNAPVPPIRVQDSRAKSLAVAIVGSGPAGIGAAFELVRAGAKVTVIDKDAEPGGLLHAGIPNFTLPRAVAERPWQQLLASGVTFVGNETVTLDTVERLRQTHDAVLLATGAESAIRLPVAGGDLDGVIDATRFVSAARASLVDAQPFTLFAARDGQDPDTLKTVLVLGAGNTAMDVARLARRLGANAICIDWMDEHYAAVRPDELKEARAEGVDIRFQRTLTRLEGDNGRVEQAVLSSTHQKNATKLPTIDDSPVTTEHVDLVVMAMGYRIDPALVGFAPEKPIARPLPDVLDRRLQASGLPAAGAPAFARHRRIGELSIVREIGRLSAALGSNDRVFVAGDALIGPSSVVEAMAQGRRAAEAILDHLARPHPPEKNRSAATILITFESKAGHTKAIADQLESALSHAGATVKTKRLSEVGLDEIAMADLVLLGTFVERYPIAGVGPARVTKREIHALTALGATRFATFCAYRFAPRKTLEKLSHLIEERGGQVIAQRAFKRESGSEIAVAQFAREIVDLLEIDPAVEALVKMAINIGGRSSTLDAAHEITALVDGRASLLLRARDQLSERVGQRTGDTSVERALHIIDHCLAGNGLTQHPSSFTRS
ncbi:MAG TPA: FAD-dependent oxidoreductase [Acidimicrobiales bacterium]|nr:FAD-dependent oxidoreductase [Acidimicrobiales bacterium]